MFCSRKFATAVFVLGSLLSVPALAQPNVDSDGFNRDSHFSGPYLTVFGGVSIPKSGNADTIVFDRNTDGTFGDTVVTSLGDNAFSPGFCSGSFATSAAGNCRDDPMRAEYGARIGYDSRMGNVVFGGLLEVNKSNSARSTSAFSITPAAYQITSKLDYGISARARVGLTPMGGALFYVTGGGSYAKIDHAFTTTNTANTFTPNNEGKMIWGWQAGGGAEIMLTNHVSLGLEYLYSRYNDNKYYVNVSQGTAAATNPFVLNGGTTNLRSSDPRFDTHALRATLGFQF